VCPGSPHIFQNKKVLETMLLYNVYIAILTLTSEYRGTVTKLQAPFFSGTADWWLCMPNTSERLLETPLPLYPSWCREQRGRRDASVWPEKLVGEFAEMQAVDEELR
jgi:hypothetical protein